ncbi:hypothetical protein ElyMa_000779200 [Elysia marginata]|uniref:RRM domain-containing protein n=1 Tax=Elysia marginata TaxID=1093978 RepID=A0AAV4GSR8_9GAST|nr:hypothetical protein ElyMa_000779200 [Elysia marginata]
MLMSARLFSCRLTHLSYQDSCPSAHGSHLTANKVPNSRERSRFRGIEESDRTTEVRQEDGQKTKQEGQGLSLAAFYCVTRDKHTSLTILDKNPFIVRRPESPYTKLIVGNIPISVSNAEIGDALKDLGVEARSSIREETYRDKDGGLTRFKTGRRFVYITLSTKPLPKTTKVGDSFFFAYLYYREQQKVGAGENRRWETGGKTTKEHVEGSSVESVEGEIHPESHRVEPNQTSESTQRSRASLPKKQTTLETFHKKITRSRSLSTTGRNETHER